MSQLGGGVGQGQGINAENRCSLNPGDLAAYPCSISSFPLRQIEEKRGVGVNQNRREVDQEASDSAFPSQGSEDRQEATQGRRSFLPYSPSQRERNGVGKEVTGHIVTLHE